MASNIQSELEAVPRDKFLLQAEVAQLFRVSTRTVSRWVDKGVFHAVKFGRFNVIPRFEVLEHINSESSPHVYEFNQQGELVARDRSTGKLKKGF